MIIRNNYLRRTACEKKLLEIVVDMREMYVAGKGDSIFVIGRQLEIDLDHTFYIILLYHTSAYRHHFSFKIFALLLKRLKRRASLR